MSYRIDIAPVSPTATTESPASSRFSSPVSSGASSPFSMVSESDEVDASPGGITVSKVKKIGLAILPGALAIVGAILLGVGTIASLGALPLGLIIAATIITGIASIVLGVIAGRDKTVTVQQAPNSDENSLAHEEEDVIEELKLEETVLSSRNEVSFDLSSLEETIPISSMYGMEPIKIHKRFFKDLFLNRAQVSIDGKTIAQMFPKENSALEQLKKIQISLEAQVNVMFPVVDDALIQQLDKAEQDYENYKSEFSEKVSQKFMELTYRKLEEIGGSEDLIAPISAALSQHVASDLNYKMLELVSSENFKGTLQPRRDLKSKGPVYSLEFSRTAAKITVTNDAEFNEIVDGCKRSKLTLGGKDASIKYTGKATVMVGINGKSKIETYIKLVPSNI